MIEVYPLKAGAAHAGKYTNHVKSGTPSCVRTIYDALLLNLVSSCLKLLLAPLLMEVMR